MTTDGPAGHPPRSGAGPTTEGATRQRYLKDSGGGVMVFDKGAYQRAYYAANKERIKATSRKNHARWKETRRKKMAHEKSERIANEKPLPDILNTDAAYIAAFIDGEGSISLFKHKGRSIGSGRYSPCIQIGNSNLANLEWIQERIGGAISHHNPDDGRRKESYKLCLTSRQTSWVLPMLLPYLRQKADRGRLVLIACAIIQSPNRSSKRFGFPVGISAREYPPLLDEIYQRMRFLNLRGSPKRASGKNPDVWKET